MNNKKKILAIVLVIVVLLLGGASIYVATQLSTRQAVAPTAPESKPAAADCTSLISLEACNAQVAPDCAWYSTCSKCAPVGTLEVNVCPEWIGSTACTVSATATAVEVGSVGALKQAYKSSTMTSANEITSVKAGDIVYFKIGGQNISSATVSGVLLTDILTGNNLDKLENITPSAGCEFEEATRKITCLSGSVNPNAWYEKSFSAKIAATVTEGMIIKNSVLASLGSASDTAEVSLTAHVTEVVNPVLEGEKMAYKNVTANTPGSYALTTSMETVSKSQIYVYSIALTNISEATATGVVIKDSLKDIPNITFMDAVAGCTWSAANVELTCNATIQPDETKTFSFRVKASDGVVNGDIISNTAKVTYTGGDAFDLTKDLTVSTVVGCNHSCTTTEECSSGLTCDSATSKCRLVACVGEDDCVCGVVVTQSLSVPTATGTIAPTKVAAVTAEPTPETLTDAGILDFPGIAAFGGGLLLAVVGILLAL